MVYLLKAFGHTSLEALDGEAGLEAARRETPDLILCDVHLPGVDGYEVARRLKGHPTLGAIPVVAVTALAMVGDRERVLAVGFDGYISKPIDPETFVGQVAAFLQDRPAVGAAAASAPAVAPPSQPGWGRRTTILAVDNSPVNLGLARSILEPLGYQVITAASAKEALALAQEAPPDLILSDVHMSRESGFDFLAAARKDPRLRSIPFVFISSTVWRDRDRTDALALGAAKFILRPIEPQALLAEIEECLEEDSDGDHPDR